jgi:hypothetical protein
MKRYTSRPGASLTCSLVAFGVVLMAGSAVAQIVIDYPRDPHWTQRSGRQGSLTFFGFI